MITSSDGDPDALTICEKPRVVFISEPVDSIGHIYRIEHPMQALSAHGWQVEGLALDDCSKHHAVDDADLVVVFRARWSDSLAAMMDHCRARGIPVAYDIDDLLFDEAITAHGQIAFLDGCPDDVKRQWIEDAERYRKALAAADAAVLTTIPLAEAAARHNPSVHVLSNALDENMEAMANEARSGTSKSIADNSVRLLFASGTPSHQRDFGVAAEAVAKLMARYDRLILRIVGHLDPEAFSTLTPFRDRIERHPRVSFDRLFGEVAACDINLCPLEPGNPFCEAKSPVRCLVAATVGLPTIASPTRPLREAIVDGCTGFLAASTVEWKTCMEKLAAAPELRKSMGRAARMDVLARYGFHSWRRQAIETYTNIIRAHGHRRYRKP